MECRVLVTRDGVAIGSPGVSVELVLPRKAPCWLGNLWVYSRLLGKDVAIITSMGLKG